MFSISRRPHGEICKRKIPGREEAFLSGARFIFYHVNFKLERLDVFARMDGAAFHVEGIINYLISKSI